MSKIKNAVLIGGLSAALAVTCFTGCESSGHRNDERSEGRASDDKRISSKVRDELDQEPVYKYSNVDVRTFNGVVQLSGFVNTESQKQRATEIAQQVPGVTQVVNSITMKPETPRAPTGRTQ